MSFFWLIKIGICGSILNLIILEFAKDIEDKDKKTRKDTSKGTYFIVYCLMEITVFQFLKNNINLLLIVPCYLILIFLFAYCRKTVNIKKAYIHSFIVNFILLVVIILVKMIMQSKINDEYLVMYYSILQIMEFASLISIL